MLGISVQAVGKYCIAGKVSFSFKDGKRYFTDLNDAARETLASRDPGRGKSRARLDGDAAPEAADPKEGVAAPIEPPDEAIGSYNKSLARKEHYKSLLAEIEYQIETGALVRKADNDKAVFNFHRTIRDRLLNIPDRIAAVLAGESDREKVHGILSKELRQALTELADEAEAIV